MKVLIALLLFGILFVLVLKPGEKSDLRQVLTPGSTQGRSAAYAIGAAPAGDPWVISRRAISENFTRAQCPTISRADRLSDGSIYAVCSNREAYRVFRFGTAGLVAMNCAGMARVGLGGC